MADLSFFSSTDAIKERALQLLTPVADNTPCSASLLNEKVSSLIGKITTANVLQATGWEGRLVSWKSSPLSRLVAYFVRWCLVTFRVQPLVNKILKAQDDLQNYTKYQVYGHSNLLKEETADSTDFGRIASFTVDFSKLLKDASEEAGIDSQKLCLETVKKTAVVWQNTLAKAKELDPIAKVQKAMEAAELREQALILGSVLPYSDAETDKLTSYLSSAQPDPKTLKPEDKQILSILACYQPEIRRILASEMRLEIFSEAKRRLLSACTTSELVVFRIKEIFARSLQSLWGKWEPIADRWMRDILRGEEFRVVTEQPCPIFQHFEIDFERLPGKILLDGKVLKKRVENGSDGVTIEAFVSELSKLSAHRADFDEKLNLILQSLLCQTTYGIPFGTALLDTVSHPARYKSDPTVDIEIRDLGATRIEVHYSVRNTLQSFPQLDRYAEGVVPSFGTMTSYFYYIVEKGADDWTISFHPDKNSKICLDPQSDSCFIKEAWNPAFLPPRS